MKFEVTSGIPLPNRRKYEFPFDEMVKGDSFDIPVNDPAQIPALRGVVHKHKYDYQQDVPGFEIKTSACFFDGELTCLRVWRVA